MKAALPRKIRDSCLCGRIMKSVRARGRGAAFTWKDFEAFGKPDAIRQALSRLVKRGKIRRVARGIYDWPRTVASLGITVAPDVEAVVDAVARHDGARIVPAGAQAANRLGLSTQVPAREVYCSTGRAHRITLGHRVIQVRHAPDRLMVAKGRAGVVISALRHLGHSDVDADDIARLRQVLGDDDKAALRRAIPRTFKWMRSHLKQITITNKSPIIGG